MKTPEQIDATLYAVRDALPKSFLGSARVVARGAETSRGMLRVLLETKPGLFDLIGEWGHGELGWLQVESAAYLGREGQQVYRAVKKALKANP